MVNQKRQSYTQEEKDRAVDLALRDGNISKVARELGYNQATLRLWVKHAKAQAPGGGLVNIEQQELARLRKEVAQLRAERDFLKKTSSYFAKDSQKWK